MKIALPESGVIKKQEIDLSDNATIIYGLNNCGKTSVLKQINCSFDRYSMTQFLENTANGAMGKLSLYIPTNRVVVSTRLTDLKTFEDIESVINYKQELHKEYDFHLKEMRDYLLKSEAVKIFIKDAVDKIFHIELTDFNIRYSDGIENIVNIYVNIIWILTWNTVVLEMSESEFLRYIKGASSYILIDEIEMFLHVSVQSNLIESLTHDFPMCHFVLSTHSPLLLTRYRESSIFCMEDGILNKIDDNLYFKDLDNIYESYFNVKELPQQIEYDIRYLGEVLMCEEEPDKERIDDITLNIQNNYPNLYRKYNNWIVKAKDKADL